MSEQVFSCFLSSLDDGRLSSPAERAEAGQSDPQALSGGWSSPQHPTRAQSLRSPIPYKKPLTGELQRRSSATLGNFSSLFSKAMLYQPGCFRVRWKDVSKSSLSV